MIRRVDLTLRVELLTRLLGTFKPGDNLEVVEIHPGACMILGGANVESLQYGS